MSEIHIVYVSNDVYDEEVGVIAACSTFEKATKVKDEYEQLQENAGKLYKYTERAMDERIRINKEASEKFPTPSQPIKTKGVSTKKLLDEYKLQISKGNIEQSLAIKEEIAEIDASNAKLNSEYSVKYKNYLDELNEAKSAKARYIESNTSEFCKFVSSIEDGLNILSGSVLIKTVTLDSYKAINIENALELISSLRTA